MRLTGEKLTLGEARNRSNPWRVLFLLALIVVGLLLVRGWQSGDVQPLFAPTPTPTRTSTSFADEAEAQFSAGNLTASIAAFQEAVAVDPQNGILWAKMARVQTYSSDLLTTLAERRDLLSQARFSIDKAIEVSPEESFAHAIKTLVYDWSASAEVEDAIAVGDLVRVTVAGVEGGRLEAGVIEIEGSGEAGAQATATSTAVGEGSFTGTVEAIGQDGWVIDGQTVYISPLTIIRSKNRREVFLLEADRAATRAVQLDPENILANAYQAEVRVDQGNIAQAADLAQAAAERAPSVILDAQYLMDVHRVYATVLENQGLYVAAIGEYEKAVKIAPNLTFLYLRIGANYRRLAASAPNPAERRRLVDLALESFEKAARINDQLQIADPNPYLAIGRTYMQDGEFFIAALNIERAVKIDPSNPEIYARLASVYFQARNYESSIDTFKCALDGCTAAQSGDLLCELGIFFCTAGTEQALAVGRAVSGFPLSGESVEYYYTYGSALTFYAGDPDHPEACINAERIFRQLMESYGQDPLISAIVDEGRALCAAPATPPAEVSATPAAFDSVTPTP